MGGELSGVIEETVVSASCSRVTVRMVPTLTVGERMRLRALYALILSATDPGHDTISRWIVDWNDGTAEVFFGPSQSLLHTYADDGLVAIAVTAMDEDGWYTAGQSVTVENVAPVLLDVVATGADEGDLSAVRGAIHDPGALDTFLVTIDWGDGSVGEMLTYPAGTTEFEAMHRYLDDQPSGYAITVAVSDDDEGNSAAAGTSVTVRNVVPSVAGLGLMSPAVGESGWATLSGSILDVGVLDTHTVAIDWGDGSAATTGVTVDEVTRTFTATHQYLDDDPTSTASDAYLITVLVWDDDDLDQAGAGSTTVIVENMSPVVTGVGLNGMAIEEGGAQVSIDENGWVTLDGVLTDVGVLDTYTAAIDWGDGTVSTAIVVGVSRTFSAAHQYVDDPGGTPEDVYPIAVTVTDDDGGIDSTTVPLGNNVAPVLLNLAITSPIAENETAILSGEFFDPGTLDAFTLSVDWGDGSAPTVVLAADATTFTLGHLYLDDKPSGTSDYLVSITVIDDDLGVGTSGVVVTVYNLAPEVTALSLNKTEIDEGDEVTLSGSFVDVGTLDTHSVAVDWGDGTTSAASVDGTTRTFSAVHQYVDDPGGTPEDVYPIAVSVTDDEKRCLRRSMSGTLPQLCRTCRSPRPSTRTM
jgi:hypothetical protein